MEPMYLSIQPEETGERIRRLLLEQGIRFGKSRELSGLKIRRPFTNGCPVNRYPASTTSLF